MCISNGPDLVSDLQQTSDPFGMPRPCGSGPGIGGSADSLDFMGWDMLGLYYTILYWDDFLVQSILMCFASCR